LTGPPGIKKAEAKSIGSVSWLAYLSDDVGFRRGSLIMANISHFIFASDQIF